jgi:hypothetical protein
MDAFGTARQRETLYSADGRPALPESAEQQFALVPYRDIAEALRRPKMTGWSRAGLIAPWVVGIMVWGFALKSSSDQRTIQATNLSQAKSLVSLAGSINDQNKEVASVVNSLQSLTTAIASSSARTDGIEARLERSRRDLKRIESKIEAAEMQLPAQLTSGAVTTPPVKPTHRHKIATDLEPGVKDAQVWSDPKGYVVYWLVPREISGNIHMIKVLPIARHPSGVVVHDVNEGVDYVVTHSGDWIREEDAAIPSAER